MTNPKQRENFLRLAADCNQFNGSESAAGLILGLKRLKLDKYISNKNCQWYDVKK